MEYAYLYFQNKETGKRYVLQQSYDMKTGSILSDDRPFHDCQEEESFFAAVTGSSVEPEQRMP